MNRPQAFEILIIEDNLLDAELMIRTLKQKHLANSLIHIQDGIEALDFLFNRGKYEDRKAVSLPKVVFLDLKLPKKNGLEILKDIRMNEATKSLPVVMITSSRENPDIQTAYALGANSYVVKPVDFPQFASTVEALGLYWVVVNTPII